MQGQVKISANLVMTYPFRIPQREWRKRRRVGHNSTIAPPEGRLTLTSLRKVRMGRGEVGRTQLYHCIPGGCFVCWCLKLGSKLGLASGCTDFDIAEGSQNV